MVGCWWCLLCFPSLFYLSCLLSFKSPSHYQTTSLVSSSCAAVFLSSRRLQQHVCILFSLFDYCSLTGWLCRGLTQIQKRCIYRKSLNSLLSWDSFQNLPFRAQPHTVAVPVFCRVVSFSAFTPWEEKDQERKGEADFLAYEKVEECTREQKQKLFNLLWRVALKQRAVGGGDGKAWTAPININQPLSTIHTSTLAARGPRVHLPWPVIAISTSNDPFSLGRWRMETIGSRDGANK